MFPIENSSSSLSSIATLRRNWGNPPEVVLADWAIQLVQLYRHQYDSSQLPLVISEEVLLVDSQGRIRFSAGPVFSSESSQGDAQYQIARLVRDWQNEAGTSDPVVADVWTHVGTALKIPVSPSRSLDSLPQTWPQADRSLNKSDPDPGTPQGVLPLVADLPAVSKPSPQVSADSPQKSKPVKKSFALPTAIGVAFTILVVASLVYWGSSGKQQNLQATSSGEALPSQPAESAAPAIAASDRDFQWAADELTLADAREQAGSGAGPLGSRSLEDDASGSNALGIPATSAIDLAPANAEPAPLLLNSSENPLFAAAPPAADAESSPRLAEPSEQEATEATPIDVSSATVLPRRDHVEPVRLLELAESQASFVSLRVLFPDGQQILLDKGAGDWHVNDPQGDAGEPIAKVFVADQALQWQWLTSATKSSLASSLPNAFLEGGFTDGNSLSIALRKPAEITDWDPQLEKGELSSVYALGTAPVRTATCSVDVVVPAPIEAAWESPGQAASFRKGETAVVFSIADHSMVQVRVQFAWAGSHRFILKHRSEIQLDPAAPWISANVEFLDRRDQQLQAYRLESQQRLVVVKDNYNRTRQEPQRSQLRLQRDGLTETMAHIDVVSKRLTLARALLHQLQTSSQWKLRVAAPWPEREPQPILSLTSKKLQEEMAAQEPAAQEKEAGVPGPKKKEIKKEVR